MWTNCCFRQGSRHANVHTGFQSPCRLQEIPMPELKNQQLPQLTGAVTPSRSMFCEPTAQPVRAEVAALDCLRLLKNVQQSRRRVLPEPMHQRHRKTLLTPINDFARHANSFSQLFQNVFRLSASHFPTRRKACGPLSKSVVEERRSHLKRSSHARSVDLRKNVASQVRLYVKILDFAEGIRGWIV